MQPDQEVINRWSGSAPFWEKHREIIRQMFAPVTQALVEDGKIGSRQVVLDIASGPGEPALTVAALTGPEGKVFGIDPIPEMVAAARRAADHLGLRNAQFDVAFADHLPFPADTFDAVISRFGVMFFPSPAEAVREMLRVLKPGRKLALAVWHFAERNPFHYTLARVMDTVCRFAATWAGCSGRIPLCQSRKIAGRSSGGRRDCSIRASAAIHDTSVDLGGRLLDTARRDVREASWKSSPGFHRSS